MRSRIQFAGNPYIKTRNQGRRYIYLTLFLLSIVIINVIGIRMLLDRSGGHTLGDNKEQQSVESKLPYGDYLPTANNPLIRVVIKSNGFSQITHSEVSIKAASGMIVKAKTGEVLQEIGANESIILKPDDARFRKDGAIQSILLETTIESDKLIIASLSRGCGTPSYRGKIELFTTAEGIVIVNELPVEEYLYAVVPSEMPASYEEEALKCQAVCARSYAYCQMLSFAYPEYEAHVDDSVSFQVYGNSGEQERTTSAVLGTAGEKLWFQNQVVKTYYYSTSCGKSTSIEAWGTPVTEENRFLQGVAICDENGADYERTYPWYRWRTEIPGKTLENLIELNTGKELGTLQNVSITETGPGGVVLKLVANGSAGSVTVKTENKIRAALGGSGYQIQKNDGTIVNSTKLLPSAFFSIAKIGENYIIEGGGYGHGIGMSQNGAHEMAKSGKTYKEILTFFYPSTKVE